MSHPHAHEGNGAHPPSVASVAEKAKEATEKVETVAGALAEALSERAKENPYGMIAAAFAVGYVAGGGLFTKTTARVLELGTKLLAIPQVRDPLLDAAEVAIDSLLEKTKPKK